VKILTWNCNLQYLKKSKQIDSFDADVLVIQECESLPNDYKPGYQLFWVGNNEKKGLAVLVRGTNSFIVKKETNDFAYFLPVQTDFGLVIGVWSFNRRAKKFGRKVSGYIVDALEAFEPEISSNAKVVIAGDFNNGPRWDLKGFHRNNFRLIQSELISRGFISAYHTAFSEEPGSEKLGTHFHQRNPQKNFHIDYIYSKGFRVAGVQLEEFANWKEFSDHVPLTAELTD
jgi:endonuclease/exonuclease/phosphatase family metal-dependent hydrolase